MADIDPPAQSAQRIAHDAAAGGTGHTEQAVQDRQTGEAARNGRWLKVSRFTILEVGDDPRFIGGRASPPCPHAKARVAIEVIRQRIYACRRARLKALAVDQAIDRALVTDGLASTCCRAGDAAKAASESELEELPVEIGQPVAERDLSADPLADE